MTYNEERFIAECIKHHAPYVDEIIVLDHGSTDNTTMIAEELGAKVVVKEIEFPDERRNYMQELAENIWCLHIDADELLELKFLKTMKRLLKTSKERNAIYLSRFNLPFGKGWPDKQPRLLNKERVAWYRKIHEVITAIGEKKTFDGTHQDETIIISGPVIIHRVTDRDLNSRIARLEKWKEILLENQHEFKDIKYEIKHLDEEISECREWMQHSTYSK